jgi:phosphopantothenate synthetase
VVKDGKLVYLGDAMDSKLRGLVFDYLIGRKSLEEILPKEGE